jgi:Acetyltransferases
MAQGEIRSVTAEQLSQYAEVVQKSFATVAEDFGFTRENAPRYIAFVAHESLKSKIADGYYPFGLFVGEEICGFVSLTDVGGGIYELNQLAVLPEKRHFGYGKKLLDFCKAKVCEFGGSKITIGIIEENIVLKDWYAANGFRHIGTKRLSHLPFTVGYMEFVL